MSQPNITSYLRPRTLEEAWGLVSKGDPSLRVLTGGSDLTINAPPEVTTLVDVSGLLDHSIESDHTGIRIGAGTTLTEVLDNSAVAAHAGGVVPEMMVHVGSPLLRNLATIGGHLARGRLSDVVPVFVALDAEVTLVGDGPAKMPLSAYLVDGHNKRPHILTGITLPRLPPSIASFRRVSRTAFDFPLLNASCRADGTAAAPDQVRIVCGATPRVAERAPGAEALLTAEGLHPSTIEKAARLAQAEVSTGSSWVASGEYRSHLVEVLVSRCLTEVMERLT
jgi:CO/xanthine dehydrogenase FAD-binding subunit